MAQVRRVIFQVFKGVLPLVLSHQGRALAALVRELKTVLRRYVEPINRRRFRGPAQLIHGLLGA